MNAIIAVIGKDQTGIIARVSARLWEYKANVLDISQSVLSDTFAMVMLADISSLTIPFAELVSKMDTLGDEIGVKIFTMHEDIFNSMHKI